MCTERGCVFPADNGLCSWHMRIFSLGVGLIGSTLPGIIPNKRDREMAISAAQQLVRKSVAADVIDRSRRTYTDTDSYRKKQRKRKRQMVALNQPHIGKDVQ